MTAKMLVLLDAESFVGRIRTSRMTLDLQRYTVQPRRVIARLDSMHFSEFALWKLTMKEF